MDLGMNVQNSAGKTALRLKQGPAADSLWKEYTDFQKNLLAPESGNLA
jgi:hypothetical protein